MTLFSPNELTDWLQYDVQPGPAAQVERVVAGWLSEATGLDAFPDPLPPALYAWAIELAGIAYENPTSMTDDQAGETRSAWADRKRQILLSAAAWGQRNATPGAGSTPSPLGRFPAAPGWPETFSRRW